MFGDMVIYMAKWYLIYIVSFFLMIACSILSSIQSGDDSSLLIYAWGLEHLPYVGFVFCLHLLYKYRNNQTSTPSILFLLAIHVGIIIWMQIKFGPYW
jgi:hypothetical protein